MHLPRRARARPHPEGVEAGERDVTFYEAVERYRTAEVALAAARQRSAAVRRYGERRDANRANQAALDARQALEHARDELVTAALEHECT